MNTEQIIEILKNTLEGKELNKIQKIYDTDVIHEDYYGMIYDFYSKYMENPIAINCLGIMYERGLGVEKNLKKAKELYEKAIKLGYSTAINNLAAMYYKGIGV